MKTHDVRLAATIISVMPRYRTRIPAAIKLHRHESDLKLSCFNARQILARNRAIEG